MGVSNNSRLLTAAGAGLLCMLFAWFCVPARAQDNVDRLFRFSLGLYKQEFFEEAAEQLEKLVKFYPEYEKRDAALYLLGESYYRLGLYDRAEKSYLRLISGYGSSALLPEARYARAWALFETGRFKEAAAGFRQVVESHSGRGDLLPEAEFRMAQSLIKAGRAEEADPVLRRIAGGGPPGIFAAEAAYNLAELFYQRGNYEEAAVWYKKVVEAFPGSSFVEHALYSLAFCRLNLADFSAARDLFSRLREQTADPSMKREAALREAKALCNLKEYREALAVLDELKSGPPFGDEIEFVRALSRFRLKEYDAARAGFNALADRYSSSPLVAESLEMAAEALFRQEKFEEAAAGFAAVIKRFPGTKWHEAAGLHLGLCHFNLGRMKQAAEVLEATQTTFPGGALAGQLLFALGEARYSAGEYSGAGAAFRAVLDIEDGTFHPASLHRLGVLAQEEAFHEEAVDWFERLADRFPGNALVTDGLYRSGQSLAALDRHEKAAELYDSLAARTGNPLVTDAVFQAGEAYKALKQYPDAIDRYTALIEEYPDSALVPKARKARAWCYYASGLLDEAVADYEDLAGRGDLTVGQLSEAQYWLGKALEKNKDFKQARMEYLKVGILYPESDSAPAAMFKVGECYRKEGNIEKAVHTLNKLMANYPGGDIIPQARRILEHLVEQPGDREHPWEDERNATEED